MCEGEGERERERSEEVFFPREPFSNFIMKVRNVEKVRDTICLSSASKQGQGLFFSCHVSASIEIIRLHRSHDQAGAHRRALNLISQRPFHPMNGLITYSLNGISRVIFQGIFLFKSLPQPWWIFYLLVTPEFGVQVTSVPAPTNLNVGLIFYKELMFQLTKTIPKIITSF